MRLFTIKPMFGRYSTLVFLCAIATLGCNGGGTKADSGGKSVVGVWDFPAQGAKSATYSFTSDGKLEEVVSTPDEAMHGTRTMTLDGNYKVDGNKLAITWEDGKVESDNSTYNQLAFASGHRLQTAIKAS